MYCCRADGCNLILYPISRWNMKRQFPASAYRLRSRSRSLSHFITYPSPYQNPQNLLLLPHNCLENAPPLFEVSLPFPPNSFAEQTNHSTKSSLHFNFPTPSKISLQLPVPDHSDGLPLHSENYDDLARRFSDLCNPDDAKHLHLQIVKNGFAGNLFLSNTLVNIYCKTGNLSSARQVFDEMAPGNAVSWACLISGYVQHGLPDSACALFCSMLRAGFFPTHFSFGSVLRACQDSGSIRLKFGLQVHGLIWKTQFAVDVVVCNQLISMYGNCCIGSAEFARRVFDGMSMRNSISWNSIISVYSRKGDALSAFRLFLEMQREDFGSGLKPSEYTLGSLITASYSSHSLSGSSGSCLLEQILSRVVRSGFFSDLYVSSALVSAFARFGLLDIARIIFSYMNERNAVSVNGLMVGLVKQKCGEEAYEIFRQMRDLVGLNCDSFVVLLSACAEFLIPKEGKRKGQEVHAYLIRSGLNNEKIAIGNGLVNMYAKCGAIDDSCAVFNHMHAKDLVSWNSLISGLDQNGHFKEALVSFQKLLRTGLMPSNFALISALSSCASLGCHRLGTQIHCEGVKLGLISDVSVLNSLIALYSECGFINDCWNVFISMPEYDQISWNSMIGALADSETSVYVVVEVFLDMMRAGWCPNGITFINILVAAASLSLLELGQQLHALVLKYCLSEDNAIENALLSCYANSGEMGNCERVFLKMYERRDEISWNSMVAGYIHNGLMSRAMDFLWLMIQNGQRMDHFTYATILSACASVAALERGMELHAHGIRACLESDVVVDSALVDMYSKCGRIDYASRVFGLMPVRNEFSWNSMISGYARHGHGEKALKLFGEMQCGDLQPDHITFVGVLSACSHVGLVDRGLEHFESMSNTYGLIPRMEHYSCMVDLLARAGELDKVEDFIRRMPMKPNVLVWRTVLSACSRSNGGKMELGKLAAEMLLELEPQNPVNYVLISNMHASGGRWEDVAKARAALKGVSVKKEAGCSWVTMKDGVHVFVAGDKSHPDTDEIYKKLHILNQRMRDAGYVPQTKFALYDLETENKEELLSVHSEKLAVAFVLIRTSGIPIRIMKNLRVCGDCHSAFQYISEIESRQIILRDSNRFHHFMDGKCSCGDYW